MTPKGSRKLRPKHSRPDSLPVSRYRFTRQPAITDSAFASGKASQCRRYARSLRARSDRGPITSTPRWRLTASRRSFGTNPGRRGPRTMAAIFHGPPEFVDLTVVDEVVG